MRHWNNWLKHEFLSHVYTLNSKYGREFTSWWDLICMNIFKHWFTPVYIISCTWNFMQGQVCLPFLSYVNFIKCLLWCRLDGNIGMYSSFMNTQKSWLCTYIIHLPNLPGANSLVVYITKNPGKPYCLSVFILKVKVLPFDVIFGGLSLPQNCPISAPSESMTWIEKKNQWNDAHCILMIKWHTDIT